MAHENEELNGGPARRDVLKWGLGGAAALAAAPLIAACGGDDSSSSSGSGGGASTSSSVDEGTPKVGGSLRIGMTGTAANESPDANGAIRTTDFARVYSLYDSLAYYDKDLNIKLGIAESIEPNATADEWTIRIKDGITFSNGKDLTAEDVAFTFQRILNPDKPLQAAVPLAPVIRDSITAVDKHTVTLKTSRPYASLVGQIAAYKSLIVPVDYDPANPIGSGPFTLASFTPMGETVLKKNPNYHDDGLPYLDEITIVPFTDFNAQLNAMLSGQVDIITSVPPSALPGLQGNNSVKIHSYASAYTGTFTMRCDEGPLADARVRQALRLLADRRAIINGAYNGAAVLGNDHFGKMEPEYNKSLPQRERNVAEAKKLLEAAGHSNLKIELVAIPTKPGALEAAEILKENAAEGGITIDIKQVDQTTFSADYYKKTTLSQDNWFYFDYLAQCTSGLLPTSRYNAGNWNDPEFLSLFDAANAEPDPAKRQEIINQMQGIEYERGPLIIPCLQNMIEVHSPKVKGLQEWKLGLPLNGCHFKELWVE